MSNVIIHTSFNMTLDEYRAVLRAIRKAQLGKVTEVESLELEHLVTNLSEGIVG